MPDKDENKPLVQLGKAKQRRNGAPSSGAPTVYNVKDPADAYAWYLNNGEVIDDKGNVVEKKPETLPVSPKATPMGVVDENGVDDNRYKTGMDYLRGISGDAGVISPEEEQRRLRRMRTASMIGNLGNVMSAFANLYYTGKGAPSQKVPDAVVPDYMSFVDRVNQARRNAEAMQMQRDRLMADAEYKNASIAQRMKDAEIRERRLLMDEQKFEWKKQYDQGILDIKAEINRINDMKTRGQIDRWEAQNYTDYLKALTGQQNADTNAAREGRLAGGQTIEETDELGNKKTKVVTPNETVSSNGRGSGSNSGGAKPAAQASSQSVSQTQTNTSGKKSTGITNWK